MWPWLPLIGTLVIQAIAAAVVYGALGEKVRQHEKRLDVHDEKFDSHGNRIVKLESWREIKDSRHGHI